MARGRRYGELARRRAYRHRTAGLVAVVVFLAVGLVSGCSTQVTPRKFPAAFVPCAGVTGTPGLCQSIQVPLDWSNPSGPASAVWVTLVPATGSPAPDPMFYISGGPGASPEQDIPWAMGAFKLINEHHDLVFIYQRGTFRSDPESCPGLTEGLATAALRANVQTCLSEVGTNARYFTTAEAARDIDYVRAQLGYQKIDLYGVSYGVTLGLAYIQRYGSHVRSAVFDSGSLLDTPVWQEAPLHAQQAFDLLAHRCQSTPACAKSYNPAADLATILARVKAQLKADPTSASAKEAAAAFLDIIDDSYLAVSTTSVLLPADLHVLARSGLSALPANRRSWFSSPSSSPQQTLLMQLSIECGDAWAAINPKAIDTNSLFAPMMVSRSAFEDTLCPLWPHNPGVSGTVRTSDPILFLNGTADPTDPPANVAAARATMPNALLISVPGSAHWVLNPSWNGGTQTPPCLLTNVAKFIDSGQPASPSSWAACTATLTKYVPAFPAAPEP